MNVCPCDPQSSFEQCCGPFITDGLSAPTPEALVRSRYSAFAMRTLDYIERTHAPEVRDDFNRAEAERIAKDLDWQGLDIVSTTSQVDGVDVEYVIRIRQSNRIVSKSSISRFRQEDGEWLLVSSRSGQKVADQRLVKVGRNDPCTCGSGKKYKKCCGSSSSAAL